MEEVEGTFHRSKRKQEYVVNSSVFAYSETENFNAKKQRLAYGCGEVPHSFPHMVNGHIAVNGHQQPNKSLQNGHNYQLDTTMMNGNQPMDINGQKADSQDCMSEAMEYSEEITGNQVEMNGNKPTSGAQRCAHGHLNTCTKYNVPCRYPRMYCHPGGILDDRLQAYHGF